jgi:hypothetical protein
MMISTKIRFGLGAAAKAMAALVAGASVLIPISAKADVVYSYTGNNYNSVSDPAYFTELEHMTGTVTLGAALADSLAFPTVVSPLAFSFSDGAGHTISNTTPGFTNVFEFGTDASGRITSWLIDLFEPGVFEIHTEQTGAAGNQEEVSGFFPGLEYATAQPNQDGWTSADAGRGVPEPSNWALMILGFGGLGAMLRRRRVAAFAA